VFDMQLAMSGDMPIKWDDDYPARLGVMPRKGSDSDVTWYDINPCYIFHPMNSYEEGNKIILDVARYEHIWRDSTMDFPSPMLWRITIDVTSGKVSEEQIDDMPAEFPRVADSMVGLKHRYGYMVSLSGNDDPDDLMSASSSILKYDCKTGQREQIDLGAGCIGGEPVFVPSQDSPNEDDGYLMTYVYDAKVDASRFVIMDAATMDSSPVASIELPRVPNGFHGSWIPTSVAG